ncbi:MAG: LPS export ABC transporter permease LptG [Candidatus Thioglobus sp.]|nr:MAG: LPS export ABC transporter permease LptG [Candidatus Thioglobus sp.]
MKILDRYIIKTLLFYTMGVMLVWVGIYALFNFINEVDLIGRQDYTALSATIYVISDLPAVIYAHFLVIIFLGCLLGLGHLAATSQLIIIRGCTVSIMQIAKKVIISALIFAFTIIFLGEMVAPITIEYAKSYKNKALGNSVAANWQNFWIKDGDTIINIKDNFDNATFGGVTLIKLKHNQLDSVLYADRAAFGDNNLRLDESKYYQFKQGEKLTNVNFENYKKYDRKISFDKTLIDALKKDPDELSSWELYQHIVFLVNNDLAAAVFELELYKRIINPLTLVAMLMLSMLFIFGSLRDSSLGKKIFLGVIISLFFELSARIGSAVSLRFDYDTLLTTSAPTLVVLVIAYLLLKKKSAR